MLTKVGFSSTGNEVMYNGMTGEQLETEIYFGPTYYERLKHMVKDKINFRARGPRSVLTRQTVGGRANDGGLRIGEMDRDSIIAHGMSGFLRESMMVRGDQFKMAVCNKSGTIAVYNESKNLFLSPIVDGPVKFVGNLEGDLNIVPITRFGRSFSIVDVPYAFKLLYQELQAMNVQMRIITAENVDQLTTLVGNNNNIVKVTGNLENFSQVKKEILRKIEIDDSTENESIENISKSVSSSPEESLFEDWTAKHNYDRSETPPNYDRSESPINYDRSESPINYDRVESPINYDRVESPPNKQRVRIKDGPDDIWIINQGPDEDGLYVISNEKTGFIEMRDTNELSFIKTGSSDTAKSPTYAPESPTYAPESPTYAPESPTCAPESPTYAPESPTYVPESPDLSNDSLQERQLSPLNLDNNNIGDLVLWKGDPQPGRKWRIASIDTVKQEGVLIPGSFEGNDRNTVPINDIKDLSSDEIDLNKKDKIDEKSYKKTPVLSESKSIMDQLKETKTEVDKSTDLNIYNTNLDTIPGELIKSTPLLDNIEEITTQTPDSKSDNIKLIRK